jgi:hypothetical protein
MANDAGSCNIPLKVKVIGKINLIQNTKRFEIFF